MPLAVSEQRLQRFFVLMDQGTFLAAFQIAVHLSRELMERAATFAYSKANRGRSELIRRTIIKSIFGARADLSDPMALYSLAMAEEKYYLAALVLQEPILGMDDDVIEKLSKSAVQAAFLLAGSTYDTTMMRELEKSFQNTSM